MVHLRADALDLPLAAGVADAVVSLNGLHVMPDPRRYLKEIARIMRPGGTLWLVTPVTARGPRSRAILGVARATGIVPAPPPTLRSLHRLLEEAGFASPRPLGGKSIAAIAAETA